MNCSFIIDFLMFLKIVGLRFDFFEIFLQIIHASLFQQCCSLYKIFKNDTVQVSEILYMLHTFYHRKYDFFWSNYSRKLFHILHFIFQFRRYCVYFIPISWGYFTLVHSIRVFYFILFLKSKYRELYIFWIKHLLEFLSFQC